MTKSRLEAFSDGVIAIILTIMVLELKVPHGDSIESLRSLIPIFISYILSFIYVAIYWSNHHHMMMAVNSVNGKILWANTHLLFWLSLVPFATAWLGENDFSKWPAVVYGIILFMNAIAYTILAKSLVKHHGKESTLAKALGKDGKGKASLVLYASGVFLAFINPLFSFGIYIFVALVWLVPDIRIEKKIQEEEKKDHAPKH